MVQRVGGFRRKTRHKLKKDMRDRGKINITKHMQSFTNGEQVVLKIDPAIHGGMPFPRFHGRAGIVIGARGKCYQVLIKDGNKDKMLLSHPGHLVKEAAKNVRNTSH